MTTLHVAPQPHSGDWGRRLLHWAPRVLAILFIAFVSMFSLDVFGVGYSFWETVVAFTMHNMPSFILIACVILAWRWPWIGSMGFLAFAIWYVATTHGFDWSVYALLAGIPALIGLLYAADWLVRRRNRE
jgi:hypothetical protein